MKLTRLKVLLVVPAVLALLMAPAGCFFERRDGGRDRDRSPGPERRDGDRQGGPRDSGRPEQGRGGR